MAKQTCLVFHLRDGRRARSFKVFFASRCLPYAIFPRDRIALVPCSSYVHCGPLLESMPFRLAASVSMAHRATDFKALLCARVRGSSVYESYTLTLRRAMAQGALVSEDLFALVEGIHGGVFIA